MKGCAKYGFGLLLCAIVIFASTASFAAAPVVKTVPYAYGTGGTVIPHPTWVVGFNSSNNTCTNTKTIRLKGMLVNNSTGPYTYFWDFGDGSAGVGGSVSNNYAIEASHAYCGAPGTIYTATLTIRNNATETAQKTYYVQVFDKTIDVEANVAIDEGLWALHKSETRTTCGSVQCGYWSKYYPFAETSAKTHAFFGAGHTETGLDEDPYTEDVQRSMRWLFTQLHSFGITSAYDSNGNGIAVGANLGDYTYQNGMFTAALIASNNQTAVTVTGPSGVYNRTYKDIAQDVVDGWAYCQYPNSYSYAYGGWRYGCRDDADNSTSQWGGISLIAAVRQWGLTVPQFVYDNNKVWLHYSQSVPGHDYGCGYGYGVFGYQSCPAWGPFAVTSSGMVQMVMDGIPRSDTNWQYAESWQRDNWDTSYWSGGPMRYHYYYGLLSFSKSMELQNPPIKMLHSNNGPADLDWYGDPVAGAARAIIDRQGQGLPGGYDSGEWWAEEPGFTGYTYPLDTAWAIQILNQTVIQTGKPVAVATANPSYALIGQTITFDGSGSYQQDSTKSIVGWQWVINHTAGATGTCTSNCVAKNGQFPTDTFSALGDYQAQLTVTDDSTPPQTASTFITVHITNPPLPPTANAGGPYSFCNQATPWYLDGSKSSTPTAGQVKEGCSTCTPNYLKSYNWNLGGNFNDLVSQNAVVDATAALSSKTPGSYLIQLEVTDDSSQAFPPSGDLTSSASQATVTLQGDCACISNLKAGATAGQIQLSWNTLGSSADSYNIYRAVGTGAFAYLNNVPAGTVVYQDKGLLASTTYKYYIKPVKNGQEWCTSTQMYVIKVDVDKCQACGDCVDTCPNELIALVEEGGKQFAMYTGNPDDCIGCYSCESACPEGSLTVTEL